MWRYISGIPDVYWQVSVLEISVAYSGPSETSKIDLYAKILLLTIFTKSFILDV